MSRTTADPAEKRSISFPHSLLVKGLARARSLGWTLSQYCQHLMREDILRHRIGAGAVRVAEHPAETYAERTEIFHHERPPAPRKPRAKKKRKAE